MTPEERDAYERARTWIRTLHRACESLVGNALARFTIVVAVPVEGDPKALAVQIAGNATRMLTEKMLERAILQHALARTDRETPGAGE